MRARAADLNLAVAAALAQGIRHQPDEGDVLAAGFAHAIVRRLQALERSLSFGVGQLGEEPCEGAALFECEVVVVHAATVHQDAGAGSPRRGRGRYDSFLGETGTEFMSQRAKVLWVI